MEKNIKYINGSFKEAHYQINQSYKKHRKNGEEKLYSKNNKRNFSKVEEIDQSLNKYTH